MTTRFDGAALGVRIKLLRELRDMSLQEVADAAASDAAVKSAA